MNEKEMFFATGPQLIRHRDAGQNEVRTAHMAAAGSCRRVFGHCPEGDAWCMASYNRAGQNKREGCSVYAETHQLLCRQEQFQNILLNNRSGRMARNAHGRMPSGIRAE